MPSPRSNGKSILLMLFIFFFIDSTALTLPKNHRIQKIKKKSTKHRRPNKGVKTKA